MNVLSKIKNLLHQLEAKQQIIGQGLRAKWRQQCYIELRSVWWRSM